MVPGVITVVLAAYQEGDSITLADCTVVANPGYRLGDLRTRLGGDSGVLVDPIRGESHAVSLAPFAGLDPNTTRILVGFQRTLPGHTPAIALPNVPPSTPGS